MRRLLAAVFLGLTAFAVHATDISVVGLFPGKALLVIDGGSPRTYSVGATVAPGIKLIASDNNSATFDNKGKREVVAIGQHTGTGEPGGRESVTLHADSRGHFYTDGQINGGMVRMVVDTGATSIAIPAHDAVRLGLNYRAGQLGYVSTANGPRPVYHVKLDSIKVGNIILHQVDATVLEGGLPVVLLGMTFLNRTEMQRSGDKMTLKKLY